MVQRILSGAHVSKLHVFLLLASCHLTCSGQETGTAWVGTWAAAPIGTTVNAGQPSPDNVTYRNIVHISIGGSVARVQLTNEFGVANLKVGSTHIAISAGKGAIQPGSDRELTFSGIPSVEIPAGAFVLSDPIAMPVAALADVVISIYLPSQPIRVTTCHTWAYSTQYVMKGDATSSPTAGASSTISAWCFLKGIDVLTSTSEHAAAIVTLGDSITDGSVSTPDTNRRWPDILAARLQGDKRTAHIGVLNEGIGSNRVLHDGYAQNAIARFDRDVIAQSGVKYLIILEGINDIGRLDAADQITANDLIRGMMQLIARAHQHGIKVFGATLTPYMGFVRSTQDGEQIRQTYNQWVRSGGMFDGVIDFDKVTRDPAHPDAFLPQYAGSDHIHPNDAGYKAMGDAIDLSLFMSTR
ncbi:MAG: SGNH/GDSL hydrolase family protein [Acidobacteria bacterium]|nr:SGNH/GDSL hydrolase family protein [Acidobacteriota bacterium]